MPRADTVFANIGRFGTVFIVFLILWLISHSAIATTVLAIVPISVFAFKLGTHGSLTAGTISQDEGGDEKAAKTGLSSGIPARRKGRMILNAMWAGFGEDPKIIICRIFWMFGLLGTLPKCLLSNKAKVALGYMRDPTPWFLGDPDLKNVDSAWKRWGYPSTDWCSNSVRYYANSMPYEREHTRSLKTDAFQQGEPEINLSPEHRSRFPARTACISYVQQKSAEGNKVQRLERGGTRPDKRYSGLRATKKVEQELCEEIKFLNLRNLWHDGLDFRYEETYNTAAGLLPYASDLAVVLIHVPHDEDHGGYHFIDGCRSYAERALQYHLYMEKKEHPLWYRLINGDFLRDLLYGRIPLAKWVQTQRLWPLAEACVGLNHGRVHMTDASKACLARLLSVMDEAIERFETERASLEESEFSCFRLVKEERFKCACGQEHIHVPEEIDDQLAELSFKRLQVRRWVAQILYPSGHLREEIAREMFLQKMWDAPCWEDPNNPGDNDRIPVVAIAGYILAERGMGGGSMNLSLEKLKDMSDPFGECIRSMIGLKLPTLPLVGEGEKLDAFVEHLNDSRYNHNGGFDTENFSMEIIEGRWQTPSSPTGFDDLCTADAKNIEGDVYERNANGVTSGLCITDRTDIRGKSGAQQREKFYFGALTGTKFKTRILEKLKQTKSFLIRVASDDRNRTMKLLDEDLAMQQRSMVPLIGETLPWYVTFDKRTYILPVLLVGGLIQNNIVRASPQGLPAPCLQAVVLLGTKVKPRADIYEAPAIAIRLDENAEIQVEEYNRIMAYVVLRRADDDSLHFAAFKTCERLGTFPVCNLPAPLATQTNMRLPTQGEMFSASNAPRDYSKDYTVITKLRSEVSYAVPERESAGNTWILQGPSSYADEVAGSPEWLLNRWNKPWK